MSFTFGSYEKERRQKSSFEVSDFFQGKKKVSSQKKSSILLYSFLSFSTQKTQISSISRDEQSYGSSISWRVTISFSYSGLNCLLAATGTRSYVHILVLYLAAYV